MAGRIPGPPMAVAGARTALGLAGFALLLSAATWVFVFASGGEIVGNAFGFRGFPAFLAPLFAMTGALIAVHRARNSIGWLLLGIALAMSVVGAATEYAILRPADPGGIAAGWVSSWLWLFGFGPAATLLVQLFPTGAPASERWRALPWIALATLLLNVFVYALRPGPLEGAPHLANPLATAGTYEHIRSVAASIGEVALPLVILLGAVSAVGRFRRSIGAERQQMKVFAFTATILATAFATMLMTGTPKPLQIAVILAVGTMPVAVAVAILRYRLFDIDVLIRRTVSYGALSAVLGGTYLALVVSLQAVLRPLTGGSEIAVAASTLATVALIQPLRRRIQDIVDRRFYRSRYDASRTLDAFVARLRDEVGLDEVRGEILDVVAATVRPTHAGLWLREGPSS